MVVSRTASSSARVAILLVGAIVLSVSAFAQTAYAPPPRTIEDILVVLDQFKPDPALAENARAELNQEPPATGNAKELADFYFKRGRASRRLGLLGRQIVDFREAAKYAEAGHADRMQILDELIVAETSGGNFLNAMRTRELQLSLKPSLGWQVVANASLAGMLAFSGDIQEARTRLARSQELMREASRQNWWQWYGSEITATVELNRGLVLAMQGKLKDAESAYRSALAAREEVVSLNPARLGARKDANTQDFVEFLRDREERWVASNLMQQGRLAEAEATLRNSLLRTLTRIGKYSTDTAEALRVLSWILFREDRNHDAGIIAQAAVDILEHIGAPPESLSLANARRAYAATLVARDRWREALTEYEKMSEGLRRDPALAQKFGRGSIEWAMALMQTGSAGDAASMLGQLLDEYVKQFGDAAYPAAEVRGYFAIALAKQGERRRALSEFRRTVPVLLEQSRIYDTDESNDAVHVRRFKQILEAYIELLATEDSQDAASRADAISESFRIADIARGSNVQRALAASAARAAISDPNLAELARQEQDAQVRLGILGNLLNRLLTAPADQQLPKVTADVRVQVDTLRADRKKLRGEIERRFPEYANLVDPKPTTIEQVRTALRAGEALISIYVAERTTYVWAIPQQGSPAFARVPVGEKAVGEIVAKLRKSLDVGDVTLDQLPRFDVAASYQLYRELLAPVEPGWTGATSLLIVPHHALGQLPFAVLVTDAVELGAEKGTRFEVYRAVPWLARMSAITQLPSVNTLVTQRSVAASSAPRREFIGFGDPYFTRSQQAQAISENSTQLASRSLRLRSLAIEKVALPAAMITEGQQKVGIRGPEIANSSTLAQLARLPDTAIEIREIAQALKADSTTDVYLGAQANEKNVKTLDLANRKVVAFATHGLVPGDLNGLEQPALALSAPDVANVDGDGLLTMDEILALKLNADWVVLSACNTASGEGAGAEAVSGLGRAFFYAGARALLVSNWPVETVSSRRLTTDLFRRQAENPGITRAEALRQTELGLIDGPGYVDVTTGKPLFSYAHPLFWAPFSLVGDGRR